MDKLEAGLSALENSDQDIKAAFKGRSEIIRKTLDAYINEIELFNAAYGLVGARTREELVVRHILDSLAPLGCIRRLAKEAPSLTLADLGSGAGLPGIPLAIALPDIQITLIERMGKRAGFLRNTLAVLGLKNAGLEETSLGQAAPTRFGLVTSRAFMPLTDKALKNMLRILMPEGILTAYKGKQEKIEKERNALQGQYPPWELLPCPVPFLDEERHFVVMKKRILAAR
ncbi:MAG: 16S rRNA (guanine(527)-N(7))-methyltransferase RsmG [Spirochaetaceae bacterium]|jgi:16S rRNA (guanine527-N7)-methyltransferase|nr:16S rRNA (guanine(527)-N(7))-methyltransferase RsmG [Spirochaetaceae bacterium]